MIVKRLKFSITAVIIFTIIFGSFFTSQPAKAQFVTTNPDLMGLLTPSTIKKDVIAPSFTTAAMMALVNAGNYFMQKLAYDTATYIGSGGKGQKPMLFTKNWGDYLGDTFKGAAGEFLGSLSETWGKGIGFNLCQPPTATLKISLMMGMTQSVKPPAPKCSWAQIAGNWGKFLDTATNGDALKAVSVSFNPGTSSLGLAVKTNATMDAYVAKKMNEATKSREGSGGFKDKTSIISGKVQTPASVMESKSKELSGMPMSSQQAGDSSFKQALAAGAWQILPSALSTFTNVLLSNFTKRLFEGLFKTEDASQADPFDFGADAGTDTVAVQAQFAYLLTPSIQDSGAYDAVTEFTVCPDQFKSVNNCVLDTSLSTAINQAKTGAPLTVADAIAQGFLNKDLPLISPKDPQNGDPYCFRKGYCYSNLVKLRRYRIIPVGWEFAAMKSDPQKPSTLGDAVKGFNNCNANGEADPTGDYQWCHLIDPNWVLKYPSTECRAMVPGETLLSVDTPTRVNACVDAPSCISENDQGKCIGGWGYCTKEKNIWRIGGDACPAYYNTCATLTRTVDGATQNLLKNTTDYSICSADNVGCRWYSRQKNLATNTWVNTNAVYLNRKAEKCEASDAGCSAFVKKDQGVRENLIVNPSFEDGGALPNYWGPDGKITEYDTAGINSFHGTRGIRVTAGAANFVESKLPIRFLPDTVYNLSVYAKKAAGSAVESESQVALSFTGIQVTDWAVLGSCTRSGNSLILKFNPADTFGRADCSFVTPESLNSDINPATISLGVSAAPGGDVWYDAVMLSEGPFTQEFVESGYGDEVPRVYLKAPPAWLGCTGAETDNPGCKAYARVCSKAEAGCELWTPKNGDPAVPAVTTANDSCPRECIGYETWRQEATAFTGVQFPLYFIPTTGLSCSANEAGCDEFTNIETAAQGGEGKEYFVDFRRCMKPNPADEATYYTWEGSDATGYQLKSFVLKKGAAQAGEAGTPPAYEAGTDYALCTKAIFNDRTNPDCREMYDADGNITYRLYSKTILSTPDCKEYRKTDSTEADCTVSGGNWVQGSSSCTYLGYKPESTTCKSAAKGCRAYVGNTGRNVREVFADNMEKPPSATVWSGVEFSTESTVAGGHSYKISGGNANFVNALAPGATYTLNVWAKGTGTFGPDIGSARDSGVPLPPAVTLTVNWKLYSFGPIRIAGNHVLDAGDKVTLVISGMAFIDNISLKQVNQNIYLIKDNWKTPASCDATSQGAYLPQAMLGCKDYTNRAGDSFALKSFSKICREANVGCSALVDTKNSAEIQPKTWGAVCRGTADSDCSYDGRVVCHVAPGRDFCNFDILGVVPAAYQNTASSTVVIPNDSVVYLVNNDANSCEAEKTGCEAVGNPEINTTKTVTIAVKFDVTNCTAKGGTVAADGKTCTVSTSIFDKLSCLAQGWTVTPDNLICTHQIVTQFTPGDCAARGGIVSQDGGKCTYNTGDKIGNFVVSAYKDDNVRNNPDDYQNILCNADAVGCEEYKSGSELLYFKDPNDRVCEYRESVNYNNELVNGWFKHGTDEPCDPAKKVGALFYDIWHNGDLQYKNWVGQCTADANMCIEFVDPVDTQNQSGKPQAYYYIDNDKIDRGSCKGQVSPKEGCVLFDQTNIVAKNYNAATTYLASDKNSNQLVAPADATNTKICVRQRTGIFCLFGSCSKIEVTPLKTCETNAVCQPADPCAGKTGFALTLCRASANRYSYTCESVTNDTNVILKVRRDRECAEWLDCRNSTKVYDSLNNNYKNICTSLDVCDSYIKQNEATRCNNFIESDVRDDSGNPAVLTAELYSSRDVRWGGRDYSGYSLPNKYSVSDLKTVSFGTNADGSEDLRLTYVDTNPADSIVCPKGDFSSPCGATNNFGRRGTCMGGSCVYGTDGQIRTAEVTYGPLAYDKVVPSTCRAYPEKDSPFPSSVATWTDETGKLAIQGGNYGASSAAQFLASKNAAFAGANVCENWLDRNNNGVVDAGELQNCECSYRKAEYQNKSAIKYFGLNGPPIPGGICTGGSKDGQSCDPLVKEACGTAESGGTCQSLTRVDRLQGWDGQCLEKDYSTPINGGTDYACLTWRPVGVIPGGRDIYNQYSQAGYNQPTATTGKYYCLLAKGNTYTQYYGGQSSYIYKQVVDKDDYSGGVGFLNSQAHGYGETSIVAPSVLMGLGFANFKKSQIFSIVLIPKDQSYDGSDSSVMIPTISDGSGTRETQAGMAKEWFDAKGNILSRSHEGVVPPGGPYAGYSYWEARWNIDWDAPTGAASIRTGQPLFAFNPDTANSVVKASCNNIGKPYFAVRALFDTNGNFVKYWTSFCNSVNSDDDRMNLIDINILLGEPCTDIAQVVSESGESAALTNNLWQNTISNFGADWAGPELKKSQHNSFYGSANSSFTPEGSKMPWFETASGLGSANVSTKYASFIDAGTHWGCDNLNGCASSTVYSTLDQFLNTTEIVGGSTLNGVNYGYPPAPNVSTMLAGPNGFWRLFSKAYDIFDLTYNGSGGYDTYSPGFGGGYDLRLIDRPSNGTRLSTYYLDYINKPPRIAAPNSACEDPKAGCDIAVLDTFSVNDQNSAANTLGDGNYFVRLKFYAWADHNHMPIISRTIDWNGNGSDVDRTVGSKYKNHKPYCGENIGECAESSRGAIGLTCDVNKNLANSENPECQAVGSNISKQCTATNPALFGNSADACVQDYFEFTHTYVCNARILGGLSACSGSNFPCKKTITDPNFPTQQIQVCVYRPRVQVVDNWHQCNGNCGTDANGNKKICFGLGTDEDSGRADCTVSGSGWTNYGGLIQVTP